MHIWGDGGFSRMIQITKKNQIQEKYIRNEELMDWTALEKMVKLEDKSEENIQRKKIGERGKIPCL